jgi:hypothetical protein
MSDAFEGVDALDLENLDNNEFTAHLTLIVAVILVKIRLVIDLQSLQSIRPRFGKLVPPEILGLIQHHAVGDITASHRSILDRDDNETMVAELKGQIVQLYEWVHKANDIFWGTLVFDGHRVESLGDKPANVAEHTYFTIREVRLCYHAWVETPGAIDAVHGIFKSRGDKMKWDWDWVD